MNERRVERVARAMCWKIGGQNPDAPAEESEEERFAWETWMTEARVAVIALSSCLTPEYDSTRDQKREDAFVELD